jgi:hypothetical protein
MSASFANAQEPEIDEAGQKRTKGLSVEVDGLADLAPGHPPFTGLTTHPNRQAPPYPPLSRARHGARECARLWRLLEASSLGNGELPMNIALKRKHTLLKVAASFHRSQIYLPSKEKYIHGFKSKPADGFGDYDRGGAEPIISPK